MINQVSPVLFLRAGHLASGSSEMRDVTIYDFSDNQRRRTIRAKSGHVELSRDGRDLILSLTDGSTTEVSRLEPERLQRVFFRTSSVKVRGIGNDLERNTSGGEKVIEKKPSVSWKRRCNWPCSAVTACSRAWGRWIQLPRARSGTPGSSLVAAPCIAGWCAPSVG